MRTCRKSLLIKRLLLAVTIAAGILVGPGQPAKAAFQVDIHGPAGSGEFGKTVTVLPNGNFVVTDPYYDNAEAADVGSAYLYDGASGSMISMLIGITSGDQVGSHGVTVLSNGNFVVSSPNWDNGTAVDAGAVTWGDKNSGVDGKVSALNSLVGSKTGDSIGKWYYALILLDSGNYIVNSPYWDNDSAPNAGAITWANGTTGVSGEISALNSLVGSTSGDQVGYVSTLNNGNYFVRSPNWDNGAAVDVGAITWADGNIGVVGEVSALNSLVGSSSGDRLSFGRDVLPLNNGNYVVISQDWDNGPAVDAGAVTWVDGESGIVGEVSALNSLVGSTTGDMVGGVALLSNGNYVVSSPYWDNGTINNAGAATWGNGNSGVSGEISRLNSLVGDSAGDHVGGITSLSNGNYVVNSSQWHNEIGAVTWVDGNTGITGEVSNLNSLVGSSEGDRVGIDVVPLSNGNFVVSSQLWDKGTLVDVGAITWGDGYFGITGEIMTVNSLVGSSTGDQVGNVVIPLSNGNYVVSSPYWDRGALVDVGAVTCLNGTGPVALEISPENSLVGSVADDEVGYAYQGGVILLNNGNYVVRNPDWDNGAAVDAGAVTWGNGNCEVIGEISDANSLVGSATNDFVGSHGLTVLANGNYLVTSPDWDNGTAVNAGAITWANGSSGAFGSISESNSLVGSNANDQVGVAFRRTDGIVLLSNGNYLVISYFWNDIGAITWGNGTSGISGEVTEFNSLVGTRFELEVCRDCSTTGGVIGLSNGNYLVYKYNWHNSTGIRLGAVTWGDGNSGITGDVSEINSLVGNYSDDGSYLKEFPLSDGSYVVKCPSCDEYPTKPNTGAISWSMDQGGITGLRTPANSVFGMTAYGGFGMTFAHDMVNNQLVVGRPAENIVTLFKKFGQQQLFLPIVVR